MRTVTTLRYRTQYPYIENVRSHGFRQCDVCRNFNKKEDTWREALRHYYAGFDSTLRVFEGR